MINIIFPEGEIRLENFGLATVDINPPVKGTV